MAEPDPARTLLLVCVLLQMIASNSNVWQSDMCASADVSYGHRIDNPDSYNFCPVPDGAADAFLFAGFAAAVGCVLWALNARLASVAVLIAGAAAELLVYSRNLGHFGNAFTLFLGVDPPGLLLYGFLPPLLLDAALGLDWFNFRKVAHHVVSYAILIVLATAAGLTPLLLYGLRLADQGWKVRRSTAICWMPRGQ